MIYSRLNNARDKNVKIFSTFAGSFFNLWFSLREYKRKVSMEWKLPHEEDTHTLYHWIKSIIPKIMNNIYGSRYSRMDQVKFVEDSL